VNLIERKDNALDKINNELAESEMLNEENMQFP